MGKAIDVGNVNDSHGMPNYVQVTNGKNVTLTTWCRVTPLSRAAARRLIGLLQEAVQTLNGDGKNG